MTRESSGGDTKATKETAYEGKTEVDEVLGKVIRRRKYYDIDFQTGVIISNEDIK